jgi:hypothetical protein
MIKYQRESLLSRIVAMDIISGCRDQAIWATNHCSEIVTVELLWAKELLPGGEVLICSSINPIRRNPLAVEKIEVVIVIGSQTIPIGGYRISYDICRLMCLEPASTIRARQEEKRKYQEQKMNYREEEKAPGTGKTTHGEGEASSAGGTKT